jgi:hypothetical protein
MTRIGTIHVRTAALGCPVKRSSTTSFSSERSAAVLGISTTGKGTTSVVPNTVARKAALAAEGEA